MYVPTHLEFLPGGPYTSTYGSLQGQQLGSERRRGRMRTRRGWWRGERQIEEEEEGGRREEGEWCERVSRLLQCREELP